MTDHDPSAALYHLFSGIDRPTADGPFLLVNMAPQENGDYLRFSAENTVVAEPCQPAAGTLQNRGWHVHSDIESVVARAFNTTMILAPAQAVERLYTIAQGVRTLNPGGLLICAAANDAGGKRLGGDFIKLGLPAPQTLSKHKSRVVWTRVTGSEDISAALAAGALQPILGSRYLSRPGLFSWNEIDPGSALLAAHIPTALTGAGADFGCGYGFLSHHLMTNHPGITSLTCIDSDARAIAACRANLTDHAARAHFLWHDLTQSLSGLASSMDWVVMNPPFHAGKAALPAIGRAFIATAHRALKKRGILFMVANARLPYEDVLTKDFSEAAIVCQDRGFKIIRAVK